ncbi:MAG: hypothetical protein FWB74_02720 [Defluviitaleaceae bacterium]|nr:hypothetical protein [Defluviitaleaceae bacterium]
MGAVRKGIERVPLTPAWRGRTRKRAARRATLRGTFSKKATIKKNVNIDRIVKKNPDSCIVAINVKFANYRVTGDVLAILTPAELEEAKFDCDVAVFYGENFDVHRLGGYF